MAKAQTSFLYQYPNGPGGTWNLYEFVLGGVNFNAAHNASNGIALPAGIPGATLGFLTDIQDSLENSLVNNISYRNDIWIGLSDRVGVATTPGVTEGTFGWTTGAPFSFVNWNLNEPNNAGTGEDAGQMTGGGGWNDNRSGFAAGSPTGDPGSTEEGGGPNFRYVREWKTNSPTPFANVRSAAALSFVGSLPGPAARPGAFGIREVRGLGLEGNLYDSVNKALGGQGTFTEGEFARLNVTDPESNAPGGPALVAPASPYLSNTGANDDNVLTIAHGQVKVPSSGDWTIQVRSDDGFALRVVGQNFSSVNGAGQIDPLDSSTILFYGGTGDSNTRGVINLAAGTYDIEFLNWEGGGGAYYEVTTSKGAITNAEQTKFLAMGDSGSTDSKLRVTPAGVTVKTVAEKPGQTANNITEARNLIAGAAANEINTSNINVARFGDGHTIGFPAGTPADEFATQVTGSFILDDGDATAGESFTLTFNLSCDDGAQLRIIGADFDFVNDFDTNGVSSLVDVNGDMSMTADFFGGDTATFGRITLTEGTYSFEGLQYEGGGGADFELFYALGDKTTTGFDDSFVPVATAAAAPDNQGWELVPEPGTGLLALLGCSVLGLRRRRN